MSHKPYNFLENIQQNQTLHNEFYANRNGIKSLIILAILTAAILLSCGIIFSSFHWLLLAWPMAALLIAVYWKQLDQYQIALRNYIETEAPKIEIPPQMYLVFTFFGIPLVEIQAKLFHMMSLILGSQLFALIVYMYLVPFSQTGIIFSMLNAIGIIFSVFILSSQNELQLVEIPKQLKLAAQNQQMNYSLS